MPYGLTALQNARFKEDGIDLPECWEIVYGDGGTERFCSGGGRIELNGRLFVPHPRDNIVGGELDFPKYTLSYLTHEPRYFVGRTDLEGAYLSLYGAVPDGAGGHSALRVFERWVLRTGGERESLFNVEFRHKDHVEGVLQPFVITSQAQQDRSPGDTMLDDINDYAETNFGKLG